MNCFYISKTTYEANGKEFCSVNSSFKYGKIPSEYSDTTKDFSTFMSWAEHGDFTVSSHLFSKGKFVWVGNEKVSEKNFLGAVRKVKFKKVEVNLPLPTLARTLSHKQLAAYIKDTYKDIFRPQNYLKG